jgi:hypothetical protein
MLLNEVNFLRWYDAFADPNLPPPPHAYWRNRYACDYRPIALPGESQSWYMNTSNGILPPNGFNSLRLNMVDEYNNLIASDIGVLQQHLIPDSPEGRFNVYCEYVVPLVKQGTKLLQIYDTVADQVLYTSTPINVRHDQQRLYETTCYVRFKHDRFYYNIRYHDIPEFTQGFRLGLSVVEGQVEGENKVYKNATNGRTRLLESVEDKVVRFETYYFDEAAHDACAIMIKHNYLEINNRLYHFKSGYKRTPNALNKLSKGEFELYDQAFASVNRC